MIEIVRRLLPFEVPHRRLLNCVVLLQGDQEVWQTNQLSQFLFRDQRVLLVRERLLVVIRLIVLWVASLGPLFPQEKVLGVKPLLGGAQAAFIAELAWQQPPGQL